MRKGVYLGAALTAALLGWYWFAVRSQRAVAEVRVPTAEVRQGALVVTLPVNGVLESVEETPVRTEIAGNLIEICEDSSEVQSGDMVYRLDTQELIDQRDELERAHTEAEDGLNTAQSDSIVNVTQAETDAEAARESLRLAQEKAAAECEKVAAQVKFEEGQTARAERELARAQRLAEMNYIPGTKLREAERAYERQQFDLEQRRAEQADVGKRTGEQVQDAQAALDLELHSLETAKADARVALEDARIRVAEAQRRLDEVNEKVEQCTLVSPVAGMAVIETNTENWPERRPYRMGDQVGSGAAPVRVYDFNRMQVRCQIGEIDISRVRAGQDAYVLSSAGNGRRYRAKVAMVEELAQDSNVWEGGTPGKKVFGILVTLSEADPAHLRPGMTVDLEIVLDEVRQAMTVPIRAVFKESGRAVVYRARGDGFERVPVTLGTRNDLLMEVTGGLNIGDRVALERPGEALTARMEAKR